jgi:hypothetical protein
MYVINKSGKYEELYRELKKSVEGANGNYYVRFMVNGNAGVGNISVFMGN